MSGPARDPGSFRDPSGHVYLAGDRVLRTVGPRAARDYEAARDSGILEKYAAAGRLIECRETDTAELGPSASSSAYVLRHPRIPFVSYPYEWSFSLLKTAALFHLDLQRDLFDDGFVLSDASAYNVQFEGPRPVFIDLLSLRRYREGEYWLAHNQFCEQFLNPLLLRAEAGIPHNEWFRGSLEGIPSRHLSAAIPAYRKLSLRMMAHVVGPARLQARSERRHVAQTVRRPLPAAAYRALLGQLRRWIAGLRPAGSGTQWQDYERFHSYSESEERAKREFVERFVSASPPAMLWDLGCNTGAYSEAAARSGAGKVIGFDYDQGALDRALARARDEGLDLLPLYLDGANPSPDQGWAQRERKGLASRAGADALLALAFIHHLAIGRNVPLEEVTAWLVGLAPRGLIEFVRKDDPTVREMLALREDVFEDYDEAVFMRALEARARVVETRRNPENGRLLVAYERPGEG